MFTPATRLACPPDFPPVCPRSFQQVRLKKNHSTNNLTGGQAVCGVGTLLEANSFGDVKAPLNLSGFETNNGLPQKSWTYDARSNCNINGVDDNTYGLLAKDVDTETIVSFVAPRAQRA